MWADFRAHAIIRENLHTHETNSHICVHMQIANACKLGNSIRVHAYSVRFLELPLPKNSRTEMRPSRGYTLVVSPVMCLHAGSGTPSCICTRGSGTLSCVCARGSGTPSFVCVRGVGDCAGVGDPFLLPPCVALPRVTPPGQ